MKQKRKPLFTFVKATHACGLALALLGGPAAQANSAITEPRPDIAVADTKARKATARAHAEKKRAVREAQELASDARGNKGIVPDIRKVRVKAVLDLPGRHTGPQLDASISAGVTPLGLSRTFQSGVAGIRTGMVGPWGNNRVRAGASGHNTRDERNSSAMQVRGLFPFALIALLVGGLYLVGHNALVRKSRRVSCRATMPKKEGSTTPEKTLITGKRMLKLFQRSPSKHTVKQEPIPAIVVAFDMDTLRDYAFNLLFARGRHDLAGVGDMLTPSLARCLMSHFSALEAKGHWNKVERVCSVKCQETESWQEGDTSYVKLAVSWKALDYVVNFNRRPEEAGYLVDGSPTAPESFNEEWFVTRRAGETWLVDAMHPVKKLNLA